MTPTRSRCAQLLPRILAAGLPMLVGCATVLGIAACGSDPSPHVAEPLAAASIGPDGGTLATADGAFSLTIPPGALSSPVAFTVEAVDGFIPPEGVTAVSPTYRVSPEGTRFAVPAEATVRLAAYEGSLDALRVGWSLVAGPTQFQQMNTRVRRIGVEAASDAIEVATSTAHLSLVFVAVPGPTPNASWQCCTPIDPAVHGAADCVLATPVAGSNCDTTICDLSSTECVLPANTPGCCEPIVAAVDHPFGCANMPDFGECVNSFGAGVCQWSTACESTPSQSPPACPDCDAASAHPDFAAAWQAGLSTWGALGCQDLEATAEPLPTSPSSAPAWTSELAGWCAFKAITFQKCGHGCPGPAPCDACEAMTSDGEFVTAFQGGQVSYQGMDCAALAQQNVPLPPFSVGVPTQLGRWCAWQEAGVAAGCGASQPAGQCDSLDACVIDPASCEAPPECAPCEGEASDPDFQFSFSLVSASYAAMTCAELQAANVPPPLGSSGDPGYAGEAGKWCGYMAAVDAACGAGTGCPAPNLCGSCETLAADPDFSAAWQGGNAAYGGMSCAQLAQQNVPPPPYTMALETQTGRWCAFQEAGAAAGCVFPAAAGQCAGFSMCSVSPSYCANGPTCNDCSAAAAHPDWVTAFDTHALPYAAMSCGALQGLTGLEPSVPQTDPLWPAQLGQWCALKAALGVQCGAGGCPLQIPCVACATLSSNPDFAAAYQGGQSAYTGMDCTTLGQQNVPSPPYSVAVETQTGRWCAFQEAGAAAGCSAPHTAAQCGALNMCTIAPGLCL